VLRTGRVGSAAHRVNPIRIDLDEVVRSSVELVRTLHRVPAEALRYGRAVRRRCSAIWTRFGRRSPT